MLSTAYSKLLLDKDNSNTGAIAQQANFWDPPSKSGDDGEGSTKDDPMQSLIR